MGMPLAIPLAVSNGEVILIVVALAVPLAAIAFIANAGDAFRSIGKGGLSVEFESDADQGLTDSGAGESASIQEDELRQMLEAKAYRQRARGEEPLDVDAEFARLRAEQSAPPSTAEPALRAEVRQLVVARNERRARQGKEPLDVDAEVERQLREFENLGQ